MGFFTRRKVSVPVVDERPAPLPTNTLAGAAQLGGDGGSGRTEPWAALQPEYRNAQAITELVGGHELIADVPALIDLPPDSTYADRPMRGGVRTAPAFGQYLEERATGGHVVMANRPPLALVEHDTMDATHDAGPTAWRDAPAVFDLCRRGAENLPAAAGFDGKARVS